MKQKIIFRRNKIIEDNWILEDNEFVSKKHKKTCKSLNYIEHLLILASTFTNFVSIYAFASVVGIFVGITNWAVGLKICVITVGNKSICQ